MSSLDTKLHSGETSRRVIPRRKIPRSTTALDIIKSDGPRVGELPEAGGGDDSNLVGASVCV